MRLSLALLLASSAASAQTITYGPLLGRGVTPDQMIVKWGTGSANDATSVSFGLKGQQLQAVTGAASKDHEIVLTGLAVGSSYDYFVQSGGTKSATSTFATCPAAGMPMDLVFYGDSRSDATEHQKVVNQVLAKAPEMVFESGDLRVDGTYAGYLSEFFPVTSKLVATTPFMAVPGNHDESSPVASNFGLIFPAPRQKPTDAWKPYYEFVCGNAMFIGLDANITTDATQLTFLKNQLAAAKADGTIDHVFVWFHQSAYSIGQHGDNTSAQKDWVPLFDDPASKVTAVFSGHDHVYNRLTDGSKVVYVVSGGAGADLYDPTSKSAATSVVFKKSYNFVLLHVSGPQVMATAFDDGGAQLDSWTAGAMGGGGDMAMGGGGGDMAGGGGGGDMAMGGGGSKDLAGSGGGGDMAGGGGGETMGGCSVGGGAHRGGWLIALGLGLGLGFGRRRRDRSI